MVKIVVDSASDIEAEEAAREGFILVPMSVRFGSEEYADGVNLSHREFFEKLVESDELPQTSQINEFCWESRFAEIVAAGDEAVVIVISSKLSGTYDCAERASRRFGGKIRVVDSLNACIGERILCNHALKLSRENKSVAEIADILDVQKKRIKLLAVLDTLQYLKKGGRISSAAAVAGELLSIKPVVAIDDGEVKMVGKAMGSKRANNLLVQLVERYGIDFGMPIMLGYSGLSDVYLKKYVADSERLWKGKADELPANMIGSTIGTHVGPGAIAVAFFAEKQ